MQCVWRWRADESQAVVRNRLRTQLTMQLWEPPLTIWWHLVELFVSIKLFNFIYACLRMRYVYVYSHNGIWICAMDKYLQPRWKVIHQLYDSFSGWGELDENTWLDFLNRVVTGNRVYVKQLLLFYLLCLFSADVSVFIALLGWSS